MMDIEFEDLGQSEFELKPYVVPKNVKTRIEFFSGFGMKEVGMILLAGMVGACLGLILWFIQGSPLWLGLAIPTGSFGFFLSKQNPRTGRNTLDILKDMRQYRNKPKRYYYRHGEGRGV